MIKISVIIPIYNAGEFIRVTLDSLLNQTMSKDEFEILAVDDVSTDNSVQIIEQYQAELPNLKIIQRTENSGGPMVPRNDALDVASGEYVHFLDNDDYLGEESLERLYNFAKANNSDVIFGKYVGVNGRGVPVSQFKKGNLANADIIKDNLIYTIAPHKMFKLAFLNANNLRFRCDVRPGDEDKLFVMLAYLEAAVISVLADYNYYYVVRRPGENLSVQKIPTDIELHFKPQRLILEHIDNSTKFNAVEKKNLKIAYINRWISFSILRTSLLSEKWGYDLSSQYFKGTKNIINRFLKRDDISRLSNPNRILAQNIISGTLESLRADDAAIKDPKRFVEFKSVNNKLLAKSDESFSFIDVDYLTKSQTMVNDVIAGDSGYVIDAVIEMESLKDVISGCSLIITNRKTQKEFVMEPFNAKNNLFLVPYSVLSEDGGPIFDIYLAAHVGPYTKRRRVGLQRSFNQLNLVSIDNEWIAYLTNGTDNVSLKEKSDSTPEVKKKGKFNIPLLGRK